MATQGRTLSRLEMMGLTPLAPLAGLGALGHAVQAAQGGGAVCANAPSYWAAFLRLLQRPPGFFGPLSEAHAAALSSQEPGLASAGAVAVQRGDLRAGDVQ